MTCMAGPKFFIVSFISKEGFHPLYLEIHLDAVGQPFDQIVQAAVVFGSEFIAAPIAANRCE